MPLFTHLPCLFLAFQAEDELLMWEWYVSTKLQQNVTTLRQSCKAHWTVNLSNLRHFLSVKKGVLLDRFEDIHPVPSEGEFRSLAAMGGREFLLQQFPQRERSNPYNVTGFAWETSSWTFSRRLKPTNVRFQMHPNLTCLENIFMCDLRFDAVLDRFINCAASISRPSSCEIHAHVSVSPLW